MNMLTNMRKSELATRLKSLENKQFTGIIRVQSKSGQNWRIFLCLSRIVWVDGGITPNRDWRRLWLKYFANIDTNKISLPEKEELECWDYNLLTLLLKKNLIKKEQVVELIEYKIDEILFDILQKEVLEGVKFAIKEAESADFLLKIGLNISLKLVTIDSALNKLEDSWQKWFKLNLTPYFPNYAPLLTEPEKLQENVSPVIYKNFQRILNGKFSLRELALKMNQDLVKITVSLANYMQKGWVQLVEIPDLADDLTPLKSVNLSSVMEGQKSLTKKPLIACIDDSPQVREIMEKIITRIGYNFIGIQDPLQAVPTLIEKTPDLIFLDLVMPIVNGYELCAQIKRVSKLENIPVIILTGNDGVVDRVRSKMVGSMGFMAKPIVEKEVINKIEKTLSQQKNKEDHENLNDKSEPSKIQLSPL